ncbi:MAG: hypothetical protein RLZZ241_674 [Bacteroidota bacterium]|jgi:hypothetical protein
MEGTEKYDSDIWLKIGQLPYMIAIGMQGAAKSGVLGSIQERHRSLESILSARIDFPGNPIISKILFVKEEDQQALQKVIENYDAALNYLHIHGIRTHKDLWERIETCANEVLPAIKKREAGHTTSDYATWLKQIALEVAQSAKEDDTLGVGGERFSALERKYYNRLENALKAFST